MDMVFLEFEEEGVVGEVVGEGEGEEEHGVQVG